MAEFAVEVRDHIMIAHSLNSPTFGPAQGLHGATFVVDVTFFRPTLNADNIVIDMAKAQAALKQVLGPLNYRNLDEAPTFAGEITSTEFLAFHIFNEMKAAIVGGELGEDAQGLTRLRVTLHESHVARAWYEAELWPGGELQS